MLINVICGNCNKQFKWLWGKHRAVCPHCKKSIAINDVTLAEGEVVKLFD